MDDATPTELEAVRLRWRAKHPDSDTDAQPSQKEFETLLQEVRERAIAIENAALELVKKQMNVRPVTERAKQAHSLGKAVMIVIGLLVLIIGASYLLKH